MLMDRDDDGDELHSGPPEVDPVPGTEDYTPTPTYDVDRWEEKEKTVPLDGRVGYEPPVETALYMLRHFELRIVPECDEIGNWDDLDRRSQRLHRTAVLQKHFESSNWGYRELEEVLEEGRTIPRELGFGSNDGTDHTTISTAIKALDVPEGFHAEAAEYSYNASLYNGLPETPSFDRLPPYPPKPRSYYELADGEKWTVDMDSKMERATKTVAEYMALVSPTLELHRDKSAAQFKYPVEEIYRLLAHIALEKCAAKNGSELLAWLSDSDTPSDSTLHEYIDPVDDDDPTYEVEEIEEMFMKATCSLLERETLAPTSPVHLAYDITATPWYGDEDHIWVTGTIPEDNTNQFWHYAVLSTVSPGRNYVLGVTPIKDRKEKAAALDRMLNQLRSHLDLELGRIYLDRQMYASGVIRKCRQHGLNWLIQAPEVGTPKRLARKTPLSKENDTAKFQMTGFKHEYEKVNCFVQRIHEDEIEYDDRVSTPSTELTRYVGNDSGSDDAERPDEQNQLSEYADEIPEAEEDPNESDAPGVGNPDTHRAWITDLDVEERDLRGLAHQYRDRWKIETAIRQIKHTFQGQCRSSRRQVRTLYFGAAQLFFNFWVALNHELPHHLGHPANFRLTGLETLHAIRDADFEAGKVGNNRII